METRSLLICGTVAHMRIFNAFDGKEVQVGGTYVDPTDGLMELVEINVPLFGPGSAVVRRAGPPAVSNGIPVPRDIPLVIRWVSILPPRQEATIPT